MILLYHSIVPDSISRFFSNVFGIIAALGGILLIYLLFAILNYFLERKKYKKKKKINKRLERIEKFLKNKKN